jgi:protein KRI1
VSQKKAFTLQDHQRLALLNSDPTLNEDIFVPPETTIPLTNVQEERLLRKEVTAAFHSAVGQDGEQEEEGEADGFLKVTTGAVNVDENKEAYRKFLLESGGGEDAVREILGLGERSSAVVKIEEDVEDNEDESEGDKDEKSGVQKKKNKKTKKVDVKRSKQDDDEFLMK